MSAEPGERCPRCKGSGKEPWRTLTELLIKPIYDRWLAPPCWLCASPVAELGPQDDSEGVRRD